MTNNDTIAKATSRLADFVDDRCKYRATDPITTRHPRDDGWRCGDEEGHSGSHTLYSAEGESVLFAGRWVHPDEVGLTPTSPEGQP